MQKSVKESVKSEHSPVFWQIVPAEILAKWRDEKRYQQKYERQNAGRAKEKFGRIRAQSSVQCVLTEQRERHETVNKNYHFAEFYIVHRLYPLFV